MAKKTDKCAVIGSLLNETLVRDVIYEWTLRNVTAR